MSDIPTIAPENICLGEEIQERYMRVRDAVRYVTDGNPKQGDLQQLANSIQRNGWADLPKLDANLNKGKGGWVYGNHRLLALAWMEDHGWKQPRGVHTINDGDDWVIKVHVGLDLDSETEAKAFVIDHNNLTLSGGTGFTALDMSRLYDSGQLQEFLGDIPSENLVSLDEDDLELLAQAFAGELGNDNNDAQENSEELLDNIEAAATGQIESRVKQGEIWALGTHRVACGDCTIDRHVTALVQGELLDLVFTDPPYGVSYADKNRSLNTVSPANRIQTPIENDHQSPEECYKNLWLPCFSALHSVAKPGCSYYVCAPQGGAQMMMMMALKDAGWLVKHELIWVKSNHVLGRADYHYRHEPILYGWKEGAAHYFIDSRSEMSTWLFDKPQESKLHPTMKPVELVEYAIKNSSRQRELVFDAFLGSGTTIIAAQNCSRKVYGFEISPHYCEVIIRRWEEFTGKTAELAGHLNG